MAAPKRFIETHTALRGVAALLVVFYHLQFGAGHRLAIELATDFFRRGYLWVDFFFVLSGFVISYTADVDRSAVFSRGEVAEFLTKRIARIYPLHVFCLLALVLFEVTSRVILLALGRTPGGEVFGTESMGLLALQLLLLHAWGFTSKVAWNIPSWSISAELFAYGMFPLVVAARVLAGGLAQFLMLGGATAFLVWIGVTTGDLDIVTGTALLRCLSGFVLGVLLCLQRERFARCSDALLSALQLGSFAAILAGIAWSWNDALLVPFFCVLVGATWCDRGLLCRGLDHGIFRRLGEISYSIYLTHVVVISAVHFVWIRIETRVDLPADLLRSCYIAFAVASTLLVSAFTYRRVECPARVWITERVLGSRGREAAQAAGLSRNERSS